MSCVGHVTLASVRLALLTTTAGFLARGSASPEFPVHLKAGPFKLALAIASALQSSQEAKSR